MENKTLSVCMITKNEEKNISRCLESIKDIADEIIVVDTGSTDKTVEIAKSFGAKTYFFKWDKNFSHARNASIEKATMDWIIFLDADEELPKEEGLKLKQIINTTPLEGFHCRLVNIVSSQNIGDALVLRVFRNNPIYRFRGKMHEQIVFSIQEEKGPQSIGTTDIKIVHYGYDPELADMDSKQKRNLELLESYPEEDRDGYFYYSLANEYTRIGEYDKALKTYEKAYNDKVPSSYMPYLCINVIKTLFSQKRYYDAIKALDKFEKVYPDMRDLYFFQALSYIECSKFTLAKQAILKYLECDLGNYVYPNNNFDSLYNIAELLTKVKKACIPHNDNLFDVIILSYQKNDFVINTIKSVNEIANNVYVVTCKDSTVEKNTLKNYGATIIETDTDDAGKNFLAGVKKCNSKYTLFLKENEILPVDSENQLVHLLNTNDIVKYLNLLILNKKDEEKTFEFRLFKNSDKLKEFNDFNDFANHVETTGRQQTPIIIHSY